MATTQTKQAIAHAKDAARRAMRIPGSFFGHGRMATGRAGRFGYPRTLPYLQRNAMTLHPSITSIRIIVDQDGKYHNQSTSLRYFFYERFPQMKYHNSHVNFSFIKMRTRSAMIERLDDLPEDSSEADGKLRNFLEVKFDDGTTEIFKGFRSSLTLFESFMEKNRSADMNPSIKEMNSRIQWPHRFINRNIELVPDDGIVEAALRYEQEKKNALLSGETAPTTTTEASSKIEGS